MRNRLWSKSIPRPFSKVCTSVKLLDRPLIVYLLELFLNAVRATTRFELGTILYASGPGWNIEKY